jgi:putative thiamine transport system permease protein
MTPRLKTLSGILPLAAFWVLPLVVGLAVAFGSAFDGVAWSALLSHPQFSPALTLSIVTGSLSLIVSYLLAFWIVAGLHRTPSLQKLMGGFLSLPHLAFAIGFGFLIMPSGLIARVLGTLLGWAAPPLWVTTQDPLGISLIAALVLKEVPFIIWLITSLMARPDFSRVMNAHFRIGQSLGHGSGSIWLRLFIPQILPRLKWPLLIVWVYGASVVDMALAIGPTQPPPLAVIIWSDLNNVDQAINARGSVGAFFLTAALIAIALFFQALLKILMPGVRQFFTRGPVGTAAPRSSAKVLLVLTTAIYILVFLLLGIMSFGSLWPYPGLWPSQFRLVAWTMISPMPFINSLVFAVASTIAALALSVVWLETMSENFDRFLVSLTVAALALPALLIADGQYLLFLGLGLNGTWFGVFLAHLTPVVAYVFIVLKGPYRAFDPRYRSVSLGLNTSALRFWMIVKMPLMRPVLAAAAAIGIGVGIAQYVPVQLIASGRLSTLTIEAVTLSSGGSRQLLAVYSLMLMVVPLLAFIAASRFKLRLA